MSLLVNGLPNCIFEGATINTDYRASVQFELLMQDNSLDDAQKLYKALDLYLPQDAENIRVDQNLIDGIIDFYTCKNHLSVLNHERAVRKDKEQESGGVLSKQIYSFEYDEGYIYSAFLACYGVDLFDVKYLHWWKFKALFMSLPQECEFCKIMGYRSMTINNKLPDEQKKFYRKMKRLYALPDKRTAEQKEKDFINSLSAVI